MKMEQINAHGLLAAYLKQNYTGKDVLVIFQDDIGSREEYQTLLQELDDVGFLPPKGYLVLGYLIIEMPAMLAKKLIDDHNKGFIRMELFSDGVCVHENR